MFNPSPMSPAPSRTEEIFPWRLQLPIYASGFFNGNVYFLTGILMPLWAAIVVKEPFLIGVVVAARQVMPVLFAIHGGALMDRFGARRVMLIFSAIGIVTMAAFPFFPFLTAIIALQMLSGMAESMGWVGSQALVGKVLKGRPVYAGRLSFALRLGGFLGPWLAGLAWHHYGPAAGFYTMAAWVAGGWIAGWLVPVTSDAAADDEVRDAFRWQELVPRLSDYVATFRMLAIPAVALVIAVTLMRQTGSGIQQSFYPIWLHDLGVTAGDIGFMVGCSHILSASTSLSVGYLTRWIREHWLLILTIGLSIVTMAVTPMLGADFIELPGMGKIYFILFGVIALRGLSQGLNMPLMMSIGMQAVSGGDQGKIVALRITTNRATTAIIPLIMGAIAQWSSLEAAFYIVGGLGLVGLSATALWVGKSPAFRKDAG
jgi:MFS family permease